MESTQMKRFQKMLLVASCAAALGLNSGTVLAQGRGGFDPAQMQQRMMDGIRERFEIKDDAEWKVIQKPIENILTLRRESMGGGMGMLFNRNRRPGGDTAGDNNG